MKYSRRARLPAAHRPAISLAQPGLRLFDDFLATLNSRHRKAIKRERREAIAGGITIHWLTGNDITEDAWDAFFAFYMETGSRKWGRPYLTRRSFR